MLFWCHVLQKKLNQIQLSVNDTTLFWQSPTLSSIEMDVQNRLCFSDQ